MIQNKSTTPPNDINIINRLNIYYRLNEIPELLGISDKTSRRLVYQVKAVDERKGNNLIDKCNGAWRIHFSLLDTFLDMLTYKISTSKQTSISTEWQSFVTININGDYNKEYYLLVFKTIKDQISLLYGVNKFYPAIEQNPNNDFCHLHFASTLSVEEMNHVVETVLKAFLTNSYDANVKNEYQYYCVKPLSRTKLIHYLSKGNLISESDYINKLDMTPPHKLRIRPYIDYNFISKKDQSDL